MMNIDSNKFWSPVFDNMSAFVCFIDCDYNLIKANESFIKFVGKNESELIGKKCHEIVHCSDTPHTDCPHLKALKTKVFEHSEFFDEHLKKWLSVEVTPIFDENNNCVGSIHIASDITERKRAEEALRASQKQYVELVNRNITERLSAEQASKKAAKLVTFYKEYAENIVGNLPVSLIVVNRDLCINFANHHFLSRMRMTKETVAGKSLAQVLGESLVEGTGLDKKIMQIIKGQEPRIEDRFVLKNKTYDFMIVPLQEQTGRRLNALLVMEDITKNVVLEEQLLHAEKLSAVGTFTASIAHEINNPLSIVVGNIQYLLSNIPQMNLTDKKEIDGLVEALITANAEAKRCAGIVTNLLHFSHRGKPEKTKLSVNSVVTGTLRLLAHQLELSKIKTAFKLADNLPFVMGNANRLQQAFVNLILNAQQVMREGGKLYVTTALIGHDVTVSFRDTGPGIPKKYIRKIFEPFYSTKEAGKGTGLGLFIIHSIMEDHRGKIEVQSKKGGGATFIIKLPAIK